MKCTWKWIAWIAGLVWTEMVLMILCGLALSLVCELASIQTIPWAEACLAGAIVATYWAATLCVSALAARETVRWFVTMKGEMQE